MRYTLEQNGVSIAVSSHGAELHSLRADGREWIWNGDEVLWGRHAPTCFPWCGKLKDGFFELDGQRYEGGQHGFARDLEHTLQEETADSLTFQLTWNADTLARYPWKFVLETRHQLAGRALHTTYRVVNEDDRAMPFQIGYHFAFAYPFTEGADTGSCQLRFQQAEDFTEITTDGGFVSGQRPRFPGQQVIPLDDHLFDVDSICFTGLRSDWAQIEELATGRALRVTFSGFPQVLIWSKPGPMRFFCIEPWYGLPERVDGGHDLFQRPCIQVLEPGQEFTCTQVVEPLVPTAE